MKQTFTSFITTDGAYDSKPFLKLLKKTECCGKVLRVYADGAYDSSKVYRLLEERGMEVVVKPVGEAA